MLNKSNRPPRFLCRMTVCRAPWIHLSQQPFINALCVVMFVCMHLKSHCRWRQSSSPAGTMLHTSGAISLSKGHMEKYTHSNLAVHSHGHTHTHTQTDWQIQTHAATCTQMSTGNRIYTNAPINLSAHLSIFSGCARAALKTYTA